MSEHESMSAARFRYCMETLQITTEQMAKNSNYSIQDVQRILHDRRAPFPALINYLERRMEFEKANPWPKQTNAMRYPKP